MKCTTWASIDHPKPTGTNLDQSSKAQCTSWFQLSRRLKNTNLKITSSACHLWQFLKLWKNDYSSIEPRRRRREFVQQQIRSTPGSFRKRCSRFWQRPESSIGRQKKSELSMTTIHLWKMTTYLQTNDAVTAVRQHSRTWRPGGSKLFRTALSSKVLGQFKTNQMLWSKRTLTWEPAAPAAPWFPFGPMATGPVTFDAIVVIASANALAYIISHVKTLKNTSNSCK